MKRKSKIRNLSPGSVVTIVINTDFKLSSQFTVKDKIDFKHSHDIIVTCPERNYSVKNVVRNVRPRRKIFKLT